MNWRKRIPLTLAFLLSLPVLSHIIILEVKAESKGDISYEPNVIPFLSVTDRPSDKPESFRFEWLGNRFDVELFFNATLVQKGVNVTRLWSLRDFGDDFDVTVAYTIMKNESCVQFGWFIENPDDVDEWIHNAWFKIEDCQPFDCDEIELKTVEVLNDTTTYNVSRFVLPDNLILSFEDLYYKGFVVGVQNKTDTEIRGFRGKKSWNLDPIVWSDNIIHVAGTYNDLFEDINSAISNSTRFSKHGENQYYSNSIINEENSSTCVDTDAQIEFNSSLTGHFITVESGSSLTFGELVDATLKNTRKGVSIASQSNTAGQRFIDGESGSTVNLYGCQILSTVSSGYQQQVALAGSGKVYNNIFSGVDLYGWSSNVDVYRNTLFADRLAMIECNCDVEDLILSSHPTQGRWFRSTTGGTVTLTNIIARGDIAYAFWFSYSSKTFNVVNSELDEWTFVWSGSQDWNVFRQYTFDLTVTYQNGTAINGTATGCRVTIQHYGQGGAVDYNATLGADGTITQQTLSRSFYNQTGGDSEYSYNPFNLRVWNHTGYDEINMNFTLSEETDWTKALIEETETTTTEDRWMSGLMWGVGGGFILFLATSIMLSVRRKEET